MSGGITAGGRLHSGCSEEVAETLEALGRACNGSCGTLVKWPRVVPEGSAVEVYECK